MNGAVEEVGQTARSVVVGLASQPLILALVLLQVLTFAGVMWMSTQRQDHFDRQYRFMLERCLPGKAGAKEAAE
jgi:hypothetical protein